MDSELRLWGTKWQTDGNRKWEMMCDHTNVFSTILEVLASAIRQEKEWNCLFTRNIIFYIGNPEGATKRFLE